MVQKLGPGRCVVVTHERLAHTSADMAGVPLFLFGHRHGYADTKFRSSRFVNVSPLDDKPNVSPFGTITDASKMGVYARITIDARDGGRSECWRLNDRAASAKPPSA